MNEFHGISDSDPIALFSHLLKELSLRNIGFVEVSEGFMKEPDLHEERSKAFFADKTEKSIRQILKSSFTSGLWIANYSFNFETAT